MNPYDCEAVRDLLPSLTRGEMLPHEVTLVELHLDACAECTAEVGLVRLLQSTLAPVPAGLEERVVGAVRRRTLLRGRPAHLAIAATLAAAIIGGSLMFQPPSAEANLDIEAVSWAAAQVPMLHGGSELHELSVEQLELLLEELDQ